MEGLLFWFSCWLKKKGIDWASAILSHIDFSVLSQYLRQHTVYIYIFKFGAEKMNDRTSTTWRFAWFLFWNLIEKQMPICRTMDMMDYEPIITWLVNCKTFYCSLHISVSLDRVLWDLLVSCIDFTVPHVSSAWWIIRFQHAGLTGIPLSLTLLHKTTCDKQRDNHSAFSEYRPHFRENSFLTSIIHLYCTIGGTLYVI